MNNKYAITKDLNMPLIVDLDGTLVDSDLLWETFLLFLRNKPYYFFLPVFWLIKGKAYLKYRLACEVDLDISSLPYNQYTIEIIKKEKSSGKKIILATASHSILAEEVARHLKLFDAVLATEGEINLSAGVKRDVLVEKYGKKQFDYIGNSSDDICIWECAHHSYVINATRSVHHAAERLGNVIASYPPKKINIGVWFKALRLHQWLKNLLIFVPLLASHNFTSWEFVANTLIAFIVFGLCASSVYILNDLFDLADDRQHPTKYLRAFASGHLSIQVGILVIPVLLLCSFGIALIKLPIFFTLGLLAYYLLTLAYSIFLKKKIVIDVITLAILYTVRIIVGSAVIGVPPSFWLLALSMFIFLSLAFVKRYAELYQLSLCSKDKAGGRGYISTDLPMIAALGAASGYVAVLVLALYINDPRTGSLYRQPQFIWLACPLILLWITRMWMLAHRGKMHQDPIVFTLRDRVSQWVFVFIALAFFGAI